MYSKDDVVNIINQVLMVSKCGAALAACPHLPDDVQRVIKDRGSVAVEWLARSGFDCMVDRTLGSVVFVVSMEAIDVGAGGNEGDLFGAQ